VNDSREICLAKEGFVYVKSTCGVPPHVATWDQNTSHLKNTATGKCICRMGDKLVEADHGGIANGLFEWTIIDGMVQNFQGLYVDGDMSLVDKTSVQWHVSDSFEEEPIVEEPVVEEPVVEEPVVEEPIVEEPVAEEPIVEEPVAEEPIVEEPVAEEPVAEEPVDAEPVVSDEEDVPVKRASALIEEALNAQAEDEDEDVPELVSEEEEPEVTPEIEQAIAETVADVLTPAEEAPTDEVEA
jgi:hypothetical protein